MEQEGDTKSEVVSDECGDGRYESKIEEDSKAK